MNEFWQIFIAIVIVILMYDHYCSGEIRDKVLKFLNKIFGG